MASTYFENIDFYRKLVAPALENAEQGKDAPTSPVLANEATDTTICARIRPLSEEEKDLQHIPGVVPKGTAKAFLFEPRKKFNGTADATKHEFAVDRVYGADSKTEKIYGEVAQELVPWIWAGGISTLFAYGQTGSGKTFTVTGITNLVVDEIMAMAEVENRELYVCCFELLGKKAYDLLDNRRVFSIMEDTFGVMRLVGVQEKCPTSASEFHSIFETSAKLRTSAPTAKNEQSSRSHSIYRIRVVNKANNNMPDGEFFLVDLAGSEGSQDSKDHSAERLAETRDINTSLSVLKDCIRGRTLWGLQQSDSGSAAKRAIHIPWRSSKLTQVLKHVFATQNEQASKTLVIACVAPSIVDSAHSKNTLRYAEMLKVPVPKSNNQRDPLDPRWWSNAKTKKWISENSGSPPIDGEILATDLNGMALCKLQQKEFISRCLRTSGVDKEQAVAFYQKFWRLQIDCRQRASKSSMNKDAESLPEPLKEMERTPFQTRIKPGMFVRLNPGAAKFDGITLAMVMSPATRDDFDSDGGERRFICALVGPSIMTDAYELHVSNQDMFCVKDMAAEVLMEYDVATRYYYMDL